MVGIHIKESIIQKIESLVSNRSSPDKEYFDQDFSRRQFLKLVGTTTAAGAMVSAGLARSDNEISLSEKLGLSSPTGHATGVPVESARDSSVEADPAEAQTSDALMAAVSGEGDDKHDGVFGNRAIGYVQNGDKDTYRFTGDLNEVHIEEGTELQLNGEKVSPDELEQKTSATCVVHKETSGSGSE